jgi:tRNA (adenine37-N6)-methyltransferase
VVELEPVGVVVGGRVEPVDDGWDAETCEIVLDDRFEPSALTGLDAFSHLEVVYRFHLVDEADVVTTARRPRGRADWPEVGIFAQRGRVRPNRLGVSICRILTIDGLRVRVQGLDAIDGSPVLDLKPHMSAFSARGPVVEPAWAVELMTGYWSTSG